MTVSHRIVRQGKTADIIYSESGERLVIPEKWSFLKAGDAAVTRSIKGKGTTWVVQERRGRRVISKGIWADSRHIRESKAEVAAKRVTPEYAKRRRSDLARRAAKQQQYLVDFCAAVVAFLNFHPRYQKEAALLGKKITAHATPVGSGTVARTERIPLAARAEVATIAWMRHQTTAYDTMRIARIKGRRREVRRKLAAQSVLVLQNYRNGSDPLESCPLHRALV